LSQSDSSLRRQLGLAAVAAVVVGDMLGSGVFFTPGELASVAETPWQVYLFWALCGGITLCGALTLAELATMLPRAGASYHIIQEGWGPFWAFLKAWMEMWVSGPGSVAGVAVVFGEFLMRFLGPTWHWSAPAWGAVAIAFFTAINLAGIKWGGRTQILLTAIKVLGILGLVAGSLFVTSATPLAAVPDGSSDGNLLGFIRLVGLGVAAVLFTYDGWIDVTHVAGEVVNPSRNLPRGLGLGVGGITLLYLIVNYAYLRVVPLDAMRQAPTTVAATVATAAFGNVGGYVLNALLLVSILGALGGLVMTEPRLYYAAAAQYAGQSRGKLQFFFRGLATVSEGSAVPVGSIVFCAAVSMVALFFFGSFSRIVNSFVVPLHIANILMVSSIFKLRRRHIAATSEYRTPWFPFVPLVYIVVIAFFLLSALVYRPFDTLVGVTLTATGIPAYFWITRGGTR
jgi:APA family basic amino acid/polyamine antiporter